MSHAVVVTQAALGAFAMVARATESPSFEGQATVADLWASLPEFPTPGSLFGDRPRCLWLTAVTGVRDDDRTLFQQFGSPRYATFRLGVRGDLAYLPQSYPTMHGLEIHGTRQGVLGEEPLVRFRAENGALRSLWSVGDRDWDRRDRGLNEFMVRPGIGTNRAHLPSQLMTLWALMHALSELARYYPDTWVTALDPDQSEAAVTIEHGLDLALEITPGLISTALRGPIPALMAQDLQRLQDELNESAALVPEAQDPDLQEEGEGEE